MSDEPCTLLDLVDRYGAALVAATSPRLEAEVAFARAAAVAAEIVAEIGRRYRAAQDLTTYTDRVTVMETLDGQA